MIHLAVQLTTTALVACVVGWLLPKYQSGIWLAGFFIMAAIVDPRPNLTSWLWIGLTVGLPVWTWAIGKRSRMEVAQ